MRIFQKVFVGILLIFLGLMGIVTGYAYSRTSGSTRQDMAEAHLLRQKSVEKNRNHQMEDKR